MVTLRWALVARNADQAKANQEVQTKAVKILGMFNERKIAEGDVIATDLKSEPQYEGGKEFPGKRGRVIGYSVTRSFQVKIRDVTVFAKLVDELLAVGGVEFSGIDAGLANEKEIRDEVWEKALANARERGEKTLTSVGMKIDSIFALSPVTFPEIRQQIFGSNAGGTGVTERMIEPPQSSQYLLAAVSITQFVHVIYLISPAK